MSDYQLSCMAGAYGPENRVPLMDGLLGPSLVHMITLGYATSARGYTCGIFQNDGKIIPQDSPQELREQVRYQYCQKIRSTPKGLKRCMASDCQGIRFAGGIHRLPPDDIKQLMKEFPIKLLKEYPEKKIFCYICHAGLAEMIRELSLRFQDSHTVEVPIAAIWAGQHKVIGHTFTKGQIINLAIEIGYPYPAELVTLYGKIKPHVTLAGLEVRANKLNEIAQLISEPVGLCFVRDVRLRLNKLNQDVLDILRSPLQKIGDKSASALSAEMDRAFSGALRAVVREIGNSTSVLCAIPSDWTNKTNFDVRIVASAFSDDSRDIQNNHFYLKPSDLKQVLDSLGEEAEPKCFTKDALEWRFCTKLLGAAGLDSPQLIVMSNIPPMQSEDSILLCVLFLEKECQLVLDEREIYPEVLDMCERICENIQQIRNVIALFIQYIVAVKTLKDRTEQLENGKKQRDLLVGNMAHQVARPITELKLTAYKLSQAFTPQAYELFRAALVEVERGARNFANYEKLTSQVDKRWAGSSTQATFHILEVLKTARKRIKPLLEVTYRTMTINANEPSLPRLAGDPEAVLECLMNVLHNAIKYSIGALPVEVDVDYNKIARQVSVRVTNCGIELPAEDCERVFDPATRSETAKQLAIEGSGLGLFITREFLKLSDGTVRVESCEPWGTTKDGTKLWRTTFLLTLEVYVR